MTTSTQQVLALLQAAMQNALEGEAFYRQAAAEGRQAQARSLFEWLTFYHLDPHTPAHDYRRGQTYLEKP